MSGEEQGGEKVYEPTQQRLEDARKKGDIAKSQDVSAAAAYIGLLLAVWAFGGGVAAGAGEALLAAFARADTLAPRMLDTGGGLAIGLVSDALLALAPLFLLPAGLVAAGLVAQRAVVFAPGKLNLKLNRVSPIANAKNKFGRTGLVEFAKSAVKMLVIAALLGFFLSDEIETLAGLSRATPVAAASSMTDLASRLLAQVALIACAIAAVDIVWQRANHASKLRMTHQEVKEEVKRAEGDPQLKSQRRRRAEEIATNRMMHDVPKAAVVIVNPTHYAVALRWDRLRDDAPVVVAKGVDGVAMRIREAAERARVPIHHDPPTARALEATVEIGRQIEPAHYRAAAAAIRFAEAMRAKARARGQ